MRKLATIIIAIMCVIFTFGVTYSVLDVVKTNEIHNLTTHYQNEINNLSSEINSLSQEEMNVINLAIRNLTGENTSSIFIDEISMTNRNATVCVVFYAPPDMCIGYTYNLTKSAEGWIITSKKLCRIC